MAKRPALPEIGPPFEGLTDETFKFLHGLRKNNTREWFEEHRDDYESDLRSPCRSLVDRMAMLFAEHDLPLISDQKRSLFRINRDIRFSKDKSPYKTHIGIAFTMEGAAKDEWMGMYFAFEPEGAKGISSFCGGGLHMPPSPLVKRTREKIATDYEKLEKLVTSRSFTGVFPKGVTGESLRRMPQGYPDDHPAADRIRMKEWVFGEPLTVDQITSPDLPETLLKFCKAGIPVLKFFAE